MSASPPEDTSGSGGAATAAEARVEQPGLRIRGIRKWYGDTRALDGLDLDARPGQILGIAGPNGAGKSTLIKILAGEVVEDEGSIELDGAPWNKHVDSDRVAVVHQEPQLFPNLTVGENMVAGREGGRLLWPELSEADQALMSDLAILEYRERLLGTVPLAIQQRTEIGRALARSARIFLFDEPNSALTQEESNDLFRRMHALASAGRVVLLVSHRIAELARHADRVALILDGRTTQILEGEDLTQENIAAGLVVGQAARELEPEAVARAEADRPNALQLSGWTHHGGEFQAVDLQVRAGEIVAIVGVEGSGARELVRSIAGFERASGSIEIGGMARPGALTERTALVSPDRQASLFTNLSISENLVARLDHEIAVRGAALHQGRIRRIGRQLREQFRIVAKSLEAPIRSLSGGNQQKVAIAAAIVKRPEVLVLEEPTRGVDVGSKREIYRLMREYAGQGHALIIFCTEVPEVFDVADIAYVVSDGELSDPLLIMNYPDVEALARAITRLERHNVAPTDATLAAAGAT
jgi:ABC-type sugar transport system ATPase subunit